MTRSRKALLAGMLTLVAVALGVPWYLATASAGPPPPLLVDFTMSHHLPVAGRLFSGLTIINRNQASVPTTLSSIGCDAEAGGNRLPARQNFFYTPPHRYIQAVVCTWRIPANAAGKRLRLWDYDGGPFGHRAVVSVGQSRYGSPEFSWRVHKP